MSVCGRSRCKSDRTITIVAALADALICAGHVPPSSHSPPLAARAGAGGGASLAVDPRVIEASGDPRPERRDEMRGKRRAAGRGGGQGACGLLELRPSAAEGCFVNVAGRSTAGSKEPGAERETARVSGGGRPIICSGVARSAETYASYFILHTWLLARRRWEERGSRGRARENRVEQRGRMVGAGV